MERDRDPWAERLAAIAWPAVALTGSLLWSRVATRALLRLAARHGRPTAAAPLPALHHVQVAMPPGRESDARAFYAGLLGLRELVKPPRLAARGGCWFALGAGELHLGVEDTFRPARKAHPALLVADLASLRSRLASAGVPVRDDEPLPGYRRFYADDPFGNRIEFLEPCG